MVYVEAVDILAGKVCFDAEDDLKKPLIVATTALADKIKDLLADDDTLNH